jgi:spore coat protein U-like protein
MTKRNVFTIIVALLVAVSGFSATTGTLLLTGTVSGVLDITVTADAAASSLDLTVSQTDLTVATINEKSNMATGYTVELESANSVADSSASAKLDGIGGVTDSLNYNIKYDGSDLTLVNGKALVTDTTLTTASVGVNKVLAISYTGDAGLQAGTYNDTLTLTIAAK